MSILMPICKSLWSHSLGIPLKLSIILHQCDVTSKYKVNETTGLWLLSTNSADSEHGMGFIKTLDDKVSALLCYKLSDYKSYNNYEDQSSLNERICTWFDNAFGYE